MATLEVNISLYLIDSNRYREPPVHDDYSQYIKVLMNDYGRGDIVWHKYSLPIAVGKF